jgi:CheY-like chemotaxis protein
MFDRPATPASAETDAQDSVERLCRLYDSRLAVGGAALSAEDVQDLKALAAVYDLDTERSPAEIWRDLRNVLIRQSPAAGRAAGTDGEALTLLVVEDDADTAADLTELLSEAGHRVVGPFHNAAAAEAAAALHPIDAALLDINLSDGATGVDLARRLSGRWAVRTIFISGDVAAAARHADQAEALVLKPYTGAQMLEAVARVGRGAAR